jgi:hypothetical protein
MPFDSSVSPASETRAAFPAKRRPDLTLGVFNADGAWKVYCASDRASAYPNRQEAMVAAEERAFTAAREGRRVELFVQEEDGCFRQATVALF